MKVRGRLGARVVLALAVCGLAAQAASAQVTEADPPAAADPDAPPADMPACAGYLVGIRLEAPSVPGRADRPDVAPSRLVNGWLVAVIDGSFAFEGTRLRVEGRYRRVTATGVIQETDSTEWWAPGDGYTYVHARPLPAPVDGSVWPRDPAGWQLAPHQTDPQDSLWFLRPWDVFQFGSAMPYGRDWRTEMRPEREVTPGVALAGLAATRVTSNDPGGTRAYWVAPSRDGLLARRESRNPEELECSVEEWTAFAQTDTQRWVPTEYAHRYYARADRGAPWSLVLIEWMGAAEFEPRVPPAGVFTPRFPCGLTVEWADGHAATSGELLTRLITGARSGSLPDPAAPDSLLLGVPDAEAWR